MSRPPRIAVLAAVLFAGVFASGCSEPRLGAPCETDGDCDDDLFCETNGAIHAVCKRRCALSPDCAGLGTNVYCARRGTCERTCAADSDCPFGGVCDQSADVCEGVTP